MSSPTRWASATLPSSWADCRHRRGFTNDFPTYFGPFGINTFDRRPKKALGVLRALWTGGAREEH